MTDSWLLNWAVMAISLFNTILLIWLGLTVILNAERRTWGLWLAGGEILLGGVFFLIHTIILGHGLNTFGRSIDLWWRIGWVPVVTIPYIWYIVILWYAGFWDRFGNRLNRRHYPWFVGTTLLAATIFVLLIFANPLPSFIQISQLNLNATPSFLGIPLLMLIYPIYILLCIALSVDVLRHPAPSGRIMGDLARRRARPWLIGAALTQILVSLLVGWVMFWVINQTRQPIYSTTVDNTIAEFDLVIAFLIAIAIIFLGQAITSYEVFTGKALPRHGLSQQWRWAVILAGGYASVISLSLSLNLQPIYNIILSALLITIFFALLNWRSFSERQSFIDQLRPFVASPRVYDHLLTTVPMEVDIEQPFKFLCERVLGTQQAYLMAKGPLAPFVGDPLTFHVEPEHPIPDIDEMIRSWITPENICVPLSEEMKGNWRWLIPLWSERGLIGILLLGLKQDGGLYAQEEIEITQTVCERLIDTRASAEIAKRLMSLQRQRLTESQVVDRRTRRVLHDEVLPQLHSSLIALSGAEDKNQAVIETLSNTHRQISDLLHDLPVVSTSEVTRRGLIAALQKTVENEYLGAFKQVTWEVTNETASQLKQLSELTSEVVYFAAREAIRNAAHHGRAGNLLPSLKITADQHLQDWEIRIENNDFDRVNIQSQEPGSGQGLAIHSTLMAVIGGELSFTKVPGERTRVILRIPRENP